MIKTSQAKELKPRDILYHKYYENADGTPQRFRVNGQVKTWKTRPDEFRVPVKRGMYEFGYVTHNDIDDYTLVGYEAENTKRIKIKVAVGSDGRIEERNICAFVIGLIAVHKDIGGHGWTITHIPTGYSIRKNRQLFSQARKIAEQLSKLDIKWETKNPEDMKKYKDKIMEIAY